MDRLSFPALSRHLLPALAAVVAGCSDGGGDLQRQVMSLREELERVNADLTQARQEIERAPGKRSGEELVSTSGEFDRAELERSYEEGARALREQVREQLRDAQIEGFTLYSPQLEEFPHRSEFAMEVRAGGRKLQIDRIPVKGNTQGKWIFPSPQEVAARVEQAKVAPSETRAAGRVAVEPTPATTNSEIVAAGAADRTIRIDWGDAPSSKAPTVSRDAAPSTQLPDRPATLAEPERPGTPRQVMPAQRDIHIKF